MHTHTYCILCMSCNVMWCNVMQCNEMHCISCYVRFVMLCYVMLCYVMLVCIAMLWYAMFCHVMLHDVRLQYGMVWYSMVTQVRTWVCVSIYIHMYVYIYIYTYICMSIYIYTYTCIYQYLYCSIFLFTYAYSYLIMYNFSCSCREHGWREIIDLVQDGIDFLIVVQPEDSGRHCHCLLLDFSCTYQLYLAESEMSKSQTAPGARCMFSTRKAHPCWSYLPKQALVRVICWDRFQLNFRIFTISLAFTPSVIVLRKLLCCLTMESRFRWPVWLNATSCRSSPGYPRCSMMCHQIAGRCSDAARVGCDDLLWLWI